MKPSKHPTQEQIADFAHKPAPARGDSVAHHLEGCQECRAYLNEVARALTLLRKDASNSLPEIGRSHLNDDIVVAYVGGTLQQEDHDYASKHLNACEPCRSAVLSYRAHRAEAALKSNQSAMPAHHHQSRWRVPFAMAASVAVTVTAIALFNSVRDETQIAIAPGESSVESAAETTVALATNTPVAPNPLNPEPNTTHAKIGVTPVARTQNSTITTSANSAEAVPAIVPANIVAVVIGNYDYTRPGVPDTPHARNDAAKIKTMLTEAMGTAPANVITLENATTAQMSELFGTAEHPNGLLSGRIKTNETDLFIYYSGHGAPDLKTKQPYLLPTDADPHLASLSGYGLDQLYRNLAHLPAHTITVVLETSFSGQSSDGPLFRNVSPGLIQTQRITPVDARMTLFVGASEGEANQLGADRSSGLFTGMFIQGMTGASDNNKDNKVTTEELAGYITSAVSATALRSTHVQQQTPYAVSATPRYLK